MVDFLRFKRGGVTYPLAAADPNSTLRQADPAVFYTMEYFESVLRTHLEEAMMERVDACGATDRIAGVVGSSVPYNPEPYLTEAGRQFPMLAVERKSSSFVYVGQRKVQVDVLSVCYVLPPLSPAQAEQLIPLLHAVTAILDNRTEQGFDPNYTPSSPPGTAGELVWSASRAGLYSAEVVSVEYGAFVPTKDLFFPAAILQMQLRERSEAVPTDLEEFEGADANQDLASDEGTIPDVVQTAFYEPTTITNVAPATGIKTGGTAVTITGTSFSTLQSYRVSFGGHIADNVVVVNATTITCLSPAVAYAGAVEVKLLDQYGQPSLPPNGSFTFTD